MLTTVPKRMGSPSALTRSRKQETFIKSHLYFILMKNIKKTSFRKSEKKNNNNKNFNDFV